MADLTLAGTGHRHVRLGGDRTKVHPRLLRYALHIIPQYAPTTIITGMADGFDQAIAEASIEIGVRFIAAIPFAGQESMWPKAAQEWYFKILEQAAEVVVTSPGSFSSAKYIIRDQWMVDHGDKVLALWDGIKKGGTWDTVKYAEKMQKPVLNIWPGWTTYE